MSWLTQVPFAIDQNVQFSCDINVKDVWMKMSPREQRPNRKKTMKISRNEKKKWEKNQMRSEWSMAAEWERVDI